MAVFGGFRKPTNRIVVAGEPIVHECKVETATNMYPGRLVQKGTNDDDIVVGTATGMPIGWLGYEQAHSAYQPSTVDTAYSLNDRAPVLNGGKFVIVGRLATGENVSKGDLLVPAANGELKKASTLTVAAGATAVTSTAANGDIISGHYGDAPIVARAMESVDASGGAADIMVLSLI